MVQAIHTAVRGRARYKVLGLYRSEPLRIYLEKRLSEKAEITGFSVNILTGNVLVFFRPDSLPAEIATLLKAVVLQYRKQRGLPAASKTARPRNNQKQKTDTHLRTDIKTRQPASTRPRISLKTAGVQIKAESPKPAAVKPRRNLKAGSLQIKAVSLKPSEKRKVKNKIRELIIRSEEQRAEDWHLMMPDEVLDKFGSSRNFGLASELAESNLKRYGPNLLPESVPRSGLSVFIEQFKSLPVALLGVSAVLSALTGGVTDAILIMGVVFINAAIGYVTEKNADKTISSLKGLVRPSAIAIRDGSPKEISAAEVAPGDILLLRPGSYVAGDCRLIEAERLSVDESALTGESMPVTKTTLPMQARDVPLADRLNMVYMGTLVTGGQGYAVVVATGRFTEIGRIQALVGEAEAPETPMERQLRVMGGQLVVISLAVCGLVFFIGLIRGYRFLQMLKVSISLAVAAVPEGLPTVATTTLALGIARMRRKKVLIRHLTAVETLGSVQVISFDKTGTVTMNRMTVVDAFSGRKRIKISDGGFMSKDRPLNPYTCEELLRLIHVTAICNETEVSLVDGRYVLNGSPTENALLDVAISSGMDLIALRARHPVLKLTHRSESRNYMTTLHGTTDGNMLLAVKGSPAEVLAMCDWHMVDGQKLLLTEDNRQEIITENERMAGDALRVLGVACCNTGEEAGCVGLEGGLVWLGLVGMADPVRKGVKGLVGAFHRAGIETVMITGDQSPTAYAIGKELNLSGEKELEILDSTHLANVEPDILKALAGRAHVYARVSPAHKLQIVQALQSAGKVVAMTGDGINDGPALKVADIGIALGHTGTDVAREVADIVLEDDDLQTMIIAVSHGRTIYNNIRKSVHYLLSTNVSEIAVMFISIAAGMGQPLNAMQLLWINLLSDIFPGLALALEAPEPDVLSRPPRDPHEPIIKKSDFKRIGFESAILSAGALGAYGYGIARYGMGPRANTMAFATLTTAQLLHAYSCRSETASLFRGETLPTNRYLHLAVGGSLALQVLAMAVPGVRSLLGITPVGLFDGLVIGGGALLPFVINEATKKKPARAPALVAEIPAREPAARQLAPAPSKEAEVYETGLHVYV